MAVQKDEELTSALKMIEGIRSSQTAGLQAIGSSQDSNIQQIYGNLQQGLGQGAQAIQGVYDRGVQNVQSAYGLGGQQANAASAGAMAQIGDNANRLGMDPRALAEVQGKLATQAGMYATRNAQSSMERSATMTQQGAGNTAIAKMAIESAKQAEALGRTDLSRKIMLELSKANTAAQTSITGATSAATSRAAERSNRAAAEANASMKQLISEQRAAAREARSAASRRETNPLDDIIKNLRIEQMKKGLGKEDKDTSIADQIRALTLDKAQYDQRERNQPEPESEDDVWNYIRTTFPNKGYKSEEKLRKAMDVANKKGNDYNDAVEYINKNAGDLNKDVLYDMLRRLRDSA